MAHQKIKNKCQISANSSAPCTTLLEGSAVQVEPAWMLLTYSTAVARQVPTPIRLTSSTRKTACLDPTSGPRALQGTGKYVKSDLALPVTYTLGTSQFTHAHKEPEKQLV